MMVFPGVQNTILGILVCLVAVGCSKSTDVSVVPETKLLFFSDFESPTDSVGWEGNGSIALHYDSLKTDGPQCLKVWGPEVLAHARKSIDTLVDSGVTIIRFEARSLGGRDGGVQLATPGGVLSWVEVSDTLWRWYIDTLQHQSWHIRSLEVWINGDQQLGTPILVDNVEVSWVGER
jgi:hypothetical protein